MARYKIRRLLCALSATIIMTSTVHVMPVKADSDPGKGTIKITRTISYPKAWDGNGFTFEDAASAATAGVQYKIYAGADIMDGADVAYEKDALVTTIICDSDGIATCDDLLPGSYYAAEVATPIKGQLPITEPVAFDITAGDVALKTFSSKPVVLDATISVTDKNDDNVTGVDVTLSNVDDIMGTKGVVAAGGTKLGTLSTSSGVSFSNLPEGSYQASYTIPKGYVDEGTVKTEDLSGSGDTLSSTSVLDEIEAGISADEAGYSASLYFDDGDGKKGEKVASWTTGDTQYVLSKISAGKYILSIDLSQAGGEGTLEKTIDVKNKAGIQSYDVDIPAGAVSVSNPVSGYELGLYKKNADGSKGVLFSSWTTDGTDKELDSVPAGNYILSVIKGVGGYVSIPDKDVTVVDGDTATSVAVSPQQIQVMVSNPVSGYGMGLYSESSDGSKGELFKSWTTDGTDKELNKVPAGNYILSVIKSVDGYVSIPDKRITVADTGDAQHFGVTSNAVVASIINPVSGYEFGLYKKTASGTKGDLYDSWTTDGTAHSLNKIPVGDYILSIIKGVDGYVSIPDQTVTIADTADEQPFTITAKQIEAKVNFELSGYEFELNKKNADGTKGELYDSWTTDGTAHNMSKIPVGNYVLSVKKGLAGYASIPDRDVAIADKAGVQNIDVSVSEIVLGVDNEVSGYEMGLYKKNADGTKGDLYDSWTTNGKEHEMTKIPAGNYIISVIKGVDGYVSIPDKDITVADSKLKQTVTVAPEIIDMSISDEVIGNSLSLYKKNEDGTKGDLYDSWTTNGKAHDMSKIPAGDYVLAMESVAEGYQRVPDMDVTVADTSDEQTVDIKAVETVGTIKLTYKDLKDGFAIPNAEIEIFGEDGETVVATVKTDENGNAEVPELPIAVYENGKLDHYIEYTAQIKETPYGYIDTKAQKTKFTYVDADTQNIVSTLDFTSQRIMGVVNITQIGDMATGTTSIESIYGNINSFTFESLALKGAEYTIYSDAECTNAVCTVNVGNDGKAVSKEIELGKYYIKETKAPNGYVLDETVSEFVLDSGEDHTVPVVETAYNNSSSAVDVELKIYTEGEVMVIKDGKFSYQKKAVPGIVFGIYCAKDVLSPIDGSVVTAAGDLVAIVKTGSDGTGKVLGKLVEGSYYYKALATADGYELDSAKTYTFDVVLGSSKIVNFDVNKDEPYKVVIKKRKVSLKNTTGDARKAVEGVEFKLYNNDDVLLGTYVTDKNGNIDVGELPYGKYYFVQTKADGYNLLSDVIEFELSATSKDVTISVTNDALPSEGDDGSGNDSTDENGDGSGWDIEPNDTDTLTEGSPETGDFGAMVPLGMMAVAAGATVFVAKGRRRKDDDDVKED